MGSCNHYSGNTLRYQGMASHQTPSRSGGIFGFLSGLFGGQRSVAYGEPSPGHVPTSAPAAADPDPQRKAVTVIVALDSQALADAVREQLAELSQNDE